ncbi:hypothetical protein LBMAG42_48860 [Deltaproteobacteria bacterium]|nr:hypothetical protein LBMAG42_48860 [Deltaproteobacteria bacterium]
MVCLLLTLGCALNDDSTTLDSAVLATSASAERVAEPTPGLAEPTPREACPMPVFAAPPVGSAAEAATEIVPVTPTPEPIDPAKVDAWLATHGGVEYLGQHRMENGETAWEMSQSIGVPVWVLRGLNPTQNLDRLHIGDWIEYPVTSNNVEAASLWYTEEECGC